MFFFPTLGENYGHVIFEALSVGCIPVISDQTPWHEISLKHAGYELSLDNDFSKILDELAKNDCRSQMAKNAVEVARERVAKNQRETGYKKIFG